jgi:hypothetical protein
MFFGVIMVGLLALIVILTIGVINGQKVSLWVLTIEPPASDKNSVSADDLNKLSVKFESKSDKAQLIKVIRQFIDKANELDNLQPNLYYKIAMAEIMIPKYGNSIDTSIPDTDRIEAYKNIQTSLKAIGFFRGEINGDHEKTNEAVKKFQEGYNKKVAKRDIIPSGEFGFFGHYTCFAIGKWSRLQGTEPGSP